MAEIEISDELIAGVLTDEWRSSYYNFTEPEQVAQHLAFNYAHGAEVEHLDGFADRKNSEVKFSDVWNEESVAEIK